MSLFLQVRTLKSIADRFTLFKERGQYLWSCRCKICGDSARNHRKTRGYFYKMDSELFYKCHNCSASMKFTSYLYQHEPDVYQQYTYERFMEEREGRPTTHPDEAVFQAAKTPKPTKSFEDVCIRLDKAPSSHPVVRYCEERQIPPERYPDLYIVEAVSDIVQVAPEYTRLLSDNDTRLAIPLRERDGTITGVTMRSIAPTDDRLRYITIKMPGTEGALRLFGDNLQSPRYVVEGAIDSLFLKDVVALSGLKVSIVNQMGLPLSTTIIFDNQPGNKDVRRMVSAYITKGYNVCIWPSDFPYKDINEAVIAGVDVLDVIKSSTYSGLMASLKFSQWK